MLHIRRRLSWIVASWLFVQLGGSVAGTIVLHASSMSADEAICQCPAAMPGAACPMHRGDGSRHRGEQSQGTTDKRHCSMRGTLAQADYALAGWLAAGAMPVLQVALLVPHSAARMLMRSVPSSTRSEHPDSPPPRS